MPRPYVQVVALFLPSHGAIRRYFEEHKDEIHHISGPYLTVVVPESVMRGDTEDVIRAPYSERFATLQPMQLPCLWVESPGEEPFAIKLPDTGSAARDALLTLMDCVRKSNSFENARNTYMSNDPNRPRDAGIPAWFAKAGYGALALTLLFLMVLVFLSVLGRASVPDGARMLIVFVVSIGVAMASSFLGGEAIAKGDVPFPFVKEHPVAFSVSGGIAVFFLALIFGYYTYGKPSESPPKLSQANGEFLHTGSSVRQSLRIDAVGVYASSIVE